MPRQETLKDVPADKVEQVVQDFKAAGATKVTKTKQSNGKFTVTATFDDANNG
jgi:hypothetical protein